MCVTPLFEGHLQEFSKKCQRLLRRAQGGGECVGDSFHVATEYLKLHLSYAVGKTGQQSKLQRGALPEFLKNGGDTCPPVPPRFLRLCVEVILEKTPIPHSPPFPLPHSSF